jgi:hypothetical protein
MMLQQKLQCHGTPPWCSTSPRRTVLFVEGERGGVNDESAVDTIVEIEGWRLPRERRDVYDEEELKVGSESDRAVGVR